jgi:hypothetical protein
MIIKDGKLVLQVRKAVTENTGSSVVKNVSAIYKGAQLVWRTVYSAVRSCFGGGIWKQDKPWLGIDTWKTN